MKTYFHKFADLTIGYTFEFEYKKKIIYLTLIMENNNLSNIVEMGSNVFCDEETNYSFWFNQDLLNKIINLEEDIEKLIGMRKMLFKNWTEEEIKEKEKEEKRIKDLYQIVKKELKKMIN